MTETVRAQNDLAARWWLFVVDGVILVVMGILLVATQLVAAQLFIEIVGFFLIIGAIIGIFATAQASTAGSASGIRWAMPIIACAIGILLLADPVGSIKILVWIIGLATLLVGALQLSAGLGLVGHEARGLLIGLGILGLITGLLMMFYPEIAAWVLSIFFGIQFIFAGMFRIGAASQLRRLSS